MSTSSMDDATTLEDHRAAPTNKESKEFLLFNDEGKFQLQEWAYHVIQKELQSTKRSQIIVVPAVIEEEKLSSLENALGFRPPIEPKVRYFTPSTHSGALKASWVEWGAIIVGLFI